MIELALALCVALAQPPSDAELPQIVQLGPDDERDFVDMLVTLANPDAADDELSRAVGVLIEPHVVAAPLEIALASQLDVITFDCADLEVAGVVGIDEAAGLVLLELAGQWDRARVAQPSAVLPDAGDEVTVGMVLPIVECGFMSGRSKPVGVYSVRDWSGWGTVMHVGVWMPWMAMGSPLVDEDDGLQGMVVSWGGGASLLAVPVERIMGIERCELIPLTEFDRDDVGGPVRARRLGGLSGRYWNGGDVAKGRRTADLALAHDPMCWLAWYSLGVCADMRGDAEKAARHLRRSIAIEPGFVESWYSLGIVALSRGQYEDAAEPLEMAVEVDPGFGRAIAMLGAVRLKQGRIDEAIALGERAIRTDDVEPNFFSNLILMYQEAGDDGDNIIRVARAWTDRMPRDGSAWAHLGVRLFDVEDWADAAEALERATELDSTNTRAWLTLSVCALSLDDPDRAEAAVRAVLAYDEHNTHARRILRAIEDAR